MSLALHIPEAEVDSCTEHIVAAIQNSHTLRVPRSEAERRNEFAAWIAVLQTRLEPLIREELERHPAQNQTGNFSPDAAVRRTWLSIRHMLIQYAILGLASAWASRHLGDVLLLGSPEPIGRQWRIPLRLTEQGPSLGQIVMDRDGNIMIEETTSHNALLETIRVQTRSPAPTTTGQ